MQKRKPNILFLFPDQYHADFLGINPDLPIKTPNLDRLCKEGTRFTNAFTPSPLCAPARACLASGRAYKDCGVLNNFQNYPLEQPTYYQRLRDQGYRVCGVGKFDLHKDTSDHSKLFWELDGSRNLDDWGFTEGIDNEGKIDGSCSYRFNKGVPQGPYMAFLKERGFADAYLEEHDNNAQNFSAYTTCLPDEAYCDNWVAENGLNFLKNFPKDQPWHLVVNFTGPHDPQDVTESMLEQWDAELPPAYKNEYADPKKVEERRRNYALAVENIDRLIGQFLQAVEERGELDNTIIVFSSDHGEMLGEHNKWGKAVWYNSSAKIPMIVAGPGVAQGTVSDALISLHDLCPTFLDYADAEKLPETEALTLRPVLEGQCSEHRKTVYSALFQEKDSDWEAIYDGQHKLVRYKNGKMHLFNLHEDTFEENDIYGQCPKKEDYLLQEINLLSPVSSIIS